MDSPFTGLCFSLSSLHSHTTVTCALLHSHRARGSNPAWWAFPEDTLNVKGACEPWRLTTQTDGLDQVILLHGIMVVFNALLGLDCLLCSYWPISPVFCSEPRGQLEGFHPGWVMAGAVGV